MSQYDVNRVEIHISGVRAFKECRLRWYFSSALRLNLEPAIPYTPFILGRGVHKALEMYYAKPSRHAAAAYRDWAHEAFEPLKQLALSDEKRTELNEALVLGFKMCEHYDLWAPEHDRFEVLRPEYKVAVPLGIEHQGATVWYAGRCDGVARTRDGKVWLLEFKTAARFPDPKTLGNDEQCSAYLAAAQRSGDFPRPEDVPQGMLYTFLRKKAPKTPDTLLDGGLSKNKRIDSSYEWYMKALGDAGEALEAYQDILLHLEASEKFFRREYVVRSVASLDYFWEGLKAVAREMLNPATAIYPSPNWWRCRPGGCLFRAPCSMVLEGLSPQPLLEQDYREREGR